MALSDRPTVPSITLTVNGQQHTVPDVGASLLDVLRYDLGLTGAKDGCSPQGQCGCCTVLVEGSPRVACVTPARRVRGREITTIEGLDSERARLWGSALCATGGSQCGFCTPGIILRLEATMKSTKAEAETDPEAKPARATGTRSDAGDGGIETALLAHLCRCTGWQTISEAAALVRTGDLTTLQRSSAATGDAKPTDDRARRITLEGGHPQTISAATALGEGGFAADTAPEGSLVALLDQSGEWVVGETMAQARSRAGKVQGRRTTMETHHPVTVPDGDFDATLQTTWVDPAYLETDASWCAPGGTPASTLGNAGAFGGKVHRSVESAARELADRHQRSVLALYSREDALREGPKRPPIGAGIRADGTGVIQVIATPGYSKLIGAIAPEFTVKELAVPGPPTSIDLRAVGWAEIAVLRAAVGPPTGPITVRSPGGGIATADGGPELITITVDAGEVLDPVILRSYCIGAAHMGWSWVATEALTVGSEGAIADLTLRSLGIVRAIDMPPVEVEIVGGSNQGGLAVNGSDAVFAAVAALAWRCSGFAPQWPARPQPE